VIQLTLRKN